MKRLLALTPTSLSTIFFTALIVVKSLFTTSITPAEQVSGCGTGTLSDYHGTVYIGNFAYEPDFGWTQSSHSYEVTCSDDNPRRIPVPYDFHHSVYEILSRDRSGDPDQTRFVGDSQQAATDQTDRNGYAYRDSTKGVDCNGERAGEYYITGYTAIRISVRGGSLDLTVTPEDNWEFDIR